jgi:hypothetical protein
MKEIPSRIVLLLFVLGVSSVFDVQPVRAWTGNVYIRSDGSVDPPDAPILRNGDLYTLMEDIGSVYGIVIERNNMTLDGAGNILQHVGIHDQDVGIWLSGTTNVTITNIEIKEFRYNMHLETSFNNKILGNRLTGYESIGGIRLESSNHNTISGNNITLSYAHSYWSLYLNNASSNTISLNYIETTWTDTYIKSGSNNTVYNNNLGSPGAQSYAASNFFDNGYPSGGNYYRSQPKIPDFFHGPYQNETGSDGIRDSRIGADRYPLVFPLKSPPTPPAVEFAVESSLTPMRTGSPLAFMVSFMLPGWNGTHVMPLTAYVWDFGDGNVTSTVDRLTVHTFMDENAYDVKLTMVEGQGFNASYSQTIEVVMSTSVSVSTGTSSTFVGFAVDVNGTLRDVHGNGLHGETVVLYYTFPGADTWVPISSDATDNLGNYHITWIPPATGYFTLKAEWLGNSTHLGTDNAVSLSSIPYRNQYVFSVESNSTVSAMAFNSTSSELSFILSGETGTRGYVKATIAKSLVANIADLHVYINGSQTEYSVDSLSDAWVLTFTCSHSVHYVTISWNLGTSGNQLDITRYIVVVAAVIVLVIAISVGAVIVTRRKRRFKEN